MINEAERADDITMTGSKFDTSHEKFSLTTTPDKDSFNLVQEFIDDKLNALDLPEKINSRVQVVADEIWSNIVNYAAKATCASLVLAKEKNVFYIEFIDDGDMYDPTKAAKPDVTLSAEERKIGGLGIHMVKKLSSAMDYRYDEGKNILKVRFEL